MAAILAFDAPSCSRFGLRTHGRFYYKNLHRFSRCFLGGSVVADEGGPEGIVRREIGKE